MGSPAPQDFKAIQDATQASLVSTIKAVNRLAAEDLAFQRTIHPHVAEQLDEQKARLLDLSNRLLRVAAQACGVRAPRALEDAEDIELNWRGIVDVLDSVLEKVDTSLDEYTGLIKKKDAARPDAASTASPAPKKPRSTQLERNIRFANVVKPQLAFELKPDNFPTMPWKPLLSTKPHATVPLSESLVRFGAGSSRSQYKHPYEAEIIKITYSDKVTQPSEPRMYQPVETTSAKWVDTFEGVLEMLEELKKVDEIAVDLEHHDWRSYFGMVSLMQISTRDKDWIVDTLKPWRHRLEVLNEVFADPSIVKVFHGAHMDVIWLQRDLGLYLVGLFDTYFACEELYPTRSLAYLLKRFVDFDADKKYQMADWRIRPLTDEMFYYARSDTHYLLYIYDMVRKDLHAKSDESPVIEDFVERVLQKSKSQALVRYEHLEADPDSGEGARGWRNPLTKHGNLSAEQFAVFRAVWNWRDRTARQEDENPANVLSQQVVFDIARILPPDAKALHSLVPPQNQIPRKGPALASLWALVRDARAQAKESGGPTSYEFLTGTHGGRSLAAAPATPKSQLLSTEGLVAKTTEESRLFGSMPISSLYDDNKPPVPDPAEIIPFSWKRYISEASIKEQPESVESSPEQMEIDDLADSKMEEEKMDEEFTLKRGLKRKTSEPEGSSASGDFLELSDGDDLDSPKPRKLRIPPSSHTVDVRERKKKVRAAAQAATNAANAAANAQRRAGRASEVDQGGDEEEDQGEEGEEGVEAEEPEANKQLSKKERKRLKKERKRQKKAAQESLEGGPTPEDDEAAENLETGTPREEAVEEGEIEEEGEGALEVSEQERRRAKKEARQQRKLEKAAAKAAKQAAEEKDEEEEPFDYGKAASVLHPPRGGGGDNGGHKGGKKVKNFNPYAKSDTHAIKGARKAPPVAGSRTAVFKK